MRREGRVGGGSETHAEAKAGDEGEGAAAPDGEHRDVEGPVFGADLCDIFRTGHVSCIAVVEVDLNMGRKNDEGRFTLRSKRRHGFRR